MPAQHNSVLHGISYKRNGLQTAVQAAQHLQALWTDRTYPECVGRGTATFLRAVMTGATMESGNKRTRLMVLTPLALATPMMSLPTAVAAPELSSHPPAGTAAICHVVKAASH